MLVLAKNVTIEREREVALYKVVGKHVYANLFGIDPKIISNLGLVEEAVLKAAELGKMHIVEMIKYKFNNLYSPDFGGVSVIALLKESHICIHTWPESEYATVDIYSCGDVSEPMVAFSHLLIKLKPKKYEHHYIQRDNK